MSAQEQNRVVVRRVIEEVINRGHWDAVDELFATNFTLHDGPPGLPGGPEGAKQWFGLFRTAFPDIHLSIDDMLAEGDKVATRFTACGTHAGELFGIPSTQKPVTWTGLVLSHLEHGKVTDDWVHLDRLGLMQQLGVIPAMEQRAN